MNRYKYLKEEAYTGNRMLPELNLVLFTWGNVSFADHDSGVFAIKPSGVSYSLLKEDDMVIVDFEGKTVEGKLRPSSDTLTHAVLYKHWNDIRSVVHTHSTYATAWAQAQKDIPIMGTTHADQTKFNIPCAPPMGDEMIEDDYELQTGFQIMNELSKRYIPHTQLEMILLGNHGPFTWGKTMNEAVSNSAILEYVAKTAYLTLQINPQSPLLKDTLIEKHHERKHGVNSYYGQK
ncbi:MAG: L-ribulose-5-phosphate 4-epimerase AraD [Tannerellaceae bacterium]|jgi:L-ribulose-5-phosphate 4-epimerase|nr:L-ribulose-5-phosphate 4-epimerase AraD [Tannerellaceae bacterium]